MVSSRDAMVDVHRVDVRLAASSARTHRIHQTLRMTPAMAAGVTDKLWEMADLVAIVEAADAAPKRPATYKKQAVAG
jgi:hypothetical protein